VQFLIKKEARSAIPACMKTTAVSIAVRDSHVTEGSRFRDLDSGTERISLVREMTFVILVEQVVDPANDRPASHFPTGLQVCDSPAGSFLLVHFLINPILPAGKTLCNGHEIAANIVAESNIAGQWRDFDQVLPGITIFTPDIGQGP